MRSLVVNHLKKKINLIKKVKKSVHLTLPKYKRMPTKYQCKAKAKDLTVCSTKTLMIVSTHLDITLTKSNFFNTDNLNADPNSMVNEMCTIV